MPNRAPVVAGRFYPGDKASLSREVTDYLQRNVAACPAKAEKVWAIMLPHAGHIYCGDVIGKTLANAKLPQRLIILSPNHTGYGTPFSVWPDGSWLTPLGAVNVDNRLASALIASGCGFQQDQLAHLREHSIETLLPFLQSAVANLEIVPITIGTRNVQALKKAAKGLAAVLSLPEFKDTGIVVSSDMNHYENVKTTTAKDRLALQAIEEMNPEKLLETVQDNNISMCGAGPMSLALFAARDSGTFETEICAHDTSGSINGDHEQVVGYAGARIYSKAN